MHCCFHPERSAGNVASVAYRYRKWNLGNDIELVARTEHDANMVAPNGDLCRINVKVCIVYSSDGDGLSTRPQGLECMIVAKDFSACIYYGP